MSIEDEILAEIEQAKAQAGELQAALQETLELLHGVRDESGLTPTVRQAFLGLD